jgi:RNA polymerase sigma-70 factor (ECF subfamily)
VERSAVLDERACVSDARAGDDAAFATLFEYYRGPIVGYLRRLVGDREVAEDLAQDTFLKAYRAIERTNEELNFRAWLYRIATNTALSYHRRQRILQWLPFSPGLREPSGEARLGERLGEEELVESALRRLKPEHASLLLLRHHQGMSLEEMAATLGVSAGVAKSRLYRARESFVRAYEALDREREDGR